jgi:glycosyltransferase involved in cell wall biosynthesis
MELKVELSELQKRKLFVATPMYGGQCAGMYTRSIADLAAICAKYQIQLQLYFLFNESLITRARNYCVDEFMRSNATHLMFIDSDIGFDPNDVLAMLALMTDESEYDVMGGPYPKKCISWEKIKQAVDKGVADSDPNTLERFVGDYVFNPKNNQNEIPLGKPAEVREIGTGFMMVRRKTFEVYQKHYPNQSYRPDHVRTAAFDGSREIMAYFDCIIERGYTYEQVMSVMNRVAAGETVPADEVKQMLEAEKHASKRYLSEDYMFCYNCDRVGLKVWFCPWMKLQHVGSYVFGGSLADLASIGASATADAGKLGKK